MSGFEFPLPVSALSVKRRMIEPPSPSETDWVGMPVGSGSLGVPVARVPLVVPACVSPLRSRLSKASAKESLP